jgi:release factor glutamine methyltransferase
MSPKLQINAGLGLTEALRFLTTHLADKKISQAEAEARVLLLAATHMSRAQMITQTDRTISASEADVLAAWMTRRLAGEPVTRLTGRRDFWTLDLRVTPDVLDPRADSEVIVETALNLLGARRHDRLRILDLGTGSGALLLAMLSECPQATGVGIDLSPAACAIAQDNAQRNGLATRATFQQGHWADALNETFDLVLSNPPYIETATIAGLDTEVRDHDPMLALDGGPDGLSAYRAIITDLPRLLPPSGLCVLELGIGQSEAVTALAEAAGLTQKALRRDLGGVERALGIGWP